MPMTNDTGVFQSMREVIAGFPARGWFYVATQRQMDRQSLKLIAGKPWPKAFSCWPVSRRNFCFYICYRDSSGVFLINMP
jgi:hypothetical protein